MQINWFDPSFQGNGHLQKVNLPTTSKGDWAPEDEASWTQTMLGALSQEAGSHGWLTMGFSSPYNASVSSTTVPLYLVLA